MTEYDLRDMKFLVGRIFELQPEITGPFIPTDIWLLPSCGRSLTLSTFNSKFTAPYVP